MKILDEWETVRLILKHRLSISRYGDGEFKICVGRPAKSQKPDETLSKKLRKILYMPQSNKHMVGIPRMFDRIDWPTPEKAKFWSNYSTPRYTDLLNRFKVYGSAFITRPDAVSNIDCTEFFALVKQIWVNRKVLLVQGEASNFVKRPIFDTASEWTELRAPSANAFSKYERIMSGVLKRSDEDTIIVLSLGPTATALAYDLSKLDRQALDLGHLGQFYAHVHPKSTGVKYE